MKHVKYAGSGYKTVDIDGQKFTVLVGTSQEEVEQWREERKLRFPTKENIEKKLKEKEKLIETGGLEPKNEMNLRKRHSNKKKSLFDQNRANKAKKPKSDSLSVKNESTLLKKLLKNEIRQENSITLQIIRHIVNTIFLAQPTG